LIALLRLGQLFVFVARPDRGGEILERTPLVFQIEAVGIDSRIHGRVAESLGKTLPIPLAGRVSGVVLSEFSHGLVLVAAVRILDEVAIILGRRNIRAELDDMVALDPGQIVGEFHAGLTRLHAWQIVDRADTNSASRASGYGDCQRSER